MTVRPARLRLLPANLIEHWHAWIGDATIADAILDRIMQCHHRFTLAGESLRPHEHKKSMAKENIKNKKVSIQPPNASWRGQ
jgi:hypothetical protein